MLNQHHSGFSLGIIWLLQEMDYPKILHFFGGIIGWRSCGPLGWYQGKFGWNVRQNWDTFPMTGWWFQTFFIFHNIWDIYIPQFHWDMSIFRFSWEHHPWRIVPAVFGFRGPQDGQKGLAQLLPGSMEGLSQRGGLSFKWPLKDWGYGILRHWTVFSRKQFSDIERMGH